MITFYDQYHIPYIIAHYVRSWPSLTYHTQ